MNKSKSHSPEVFRLPKIVPNLAKANAARISMESFTGEEEAVLVGVQTGGHPPAPPTPPLPVSVTGSLENRFLNSSSFSGLR